jgi:glycerol-3-phosphate acyltransferase PlsY
LLIIELSVLGFALGSLPFSLWLAKVMVGVDVRKIDDGNPGAINAWRAGGSKVGIPALLLDFLKGALPVGLAAHLGIQGWGLVPIILAPPVGHAFSPLLGLRGGKAVAATFGVWSGVTNWLVPTVLGVLMTVGKALKVPDAWTVLLSGVGGLAFVGLFFRQGPLAVAFAMNLGLLIFKYRKDLVFGKGQRWHF